MAAVCGPRPTWASGKCRLSSGRFGLWPDQPSPKCTNEGQCLALAREFQAEHRPIIRHLPEDDWLRAMVVQPAPHIAHRSAKIARRAEFDNVQHACPPSPPGDGMRRYVG